MAFQVLTLLAACAQNRDESPDSRSGAPIDRYILLRSGRVTLAEPLPLSVRTAAAIPAGATLVPLSSESFGGAERITLHLSPDGRLAGAVFDFAHGVDFEAKVRGYAPLGTPIRSQETRRGEEPADVVTWQDARTTFTLRRDPNRSAWTVRGELWDRAMHSVPTSADTSPR